MGIENALQAEVDLVTVSQQFVQLLLAQPRRLDILLAVFAGSQFLSDTLIRHPDFFEWATQPDRLHRRRERPELLEAFRELARQSASPPAWRDAVRRGRLRVWRLASTPRPLDRIAASEVGATDFSRLSDRPNSACELFVWGRGDAGPFFRG